MHHNLNRTRFRSLIGAGALAASVAVLNPSALAQTAPNVSGTVNQAGQTANQTLGTVGQTANQTLGTANQTVGTVGQTAQGVVGGLQPTLQPVGQGVGSALNNLTQPDTVNALLQFLSTVVPNHIEAHVRLDALRVEKLTVDVRGVDLRNLKVDLLVANSRGAGQVQPAINPDGTTNSSSTNSSATNSSATNSANSSNSGLSVLPSNSTVNSGGAVNR